MRYETAGALRAHGKEQERFENVWCKNPFDPTTVQSRMSAATIRVLGLSVSPVISRPSKSSNVFSLLPRTAIQQMANTCLRSNRLGRNGCLNPTTCLPFVRRAHAGDHA